MRSSGSLPGFVGCTVDSINIRQGEAIPVTETVVFGRVSVTTEGWLLQTPIRVIMRSLRRYRCRAYGIREGSARRRTDR